MIFDTHSHYNDEAFQDDLPAIVRQFPEAGICGAVNVASDLSSIDEVLALAKAYPRFYAALGIHPSDCAPLTESRLLLIQEKLHEPKVVAVGEIGLDYHYDEPDREMQKKWFRRQLRMAQEADLPVIIHSRDANCRIRFRSSWRSRDISAAELFTAIPTVRKWRSSLYGWVITSALEAL